MDIEKKLDRIIVLFIVLIILLIIQFVCSVIMYITFSAGHFEALRQILY